MSDDEQQIRDLVDTWLDATRAGDVDTVLSLMADDAVFLIQGRPPMTKSEFAEISRSQAGPDAPVYDATSEIQEIQVSGDLAYLWQRLRVTTRSSEGKNTGTLSGHTLTVFRKEHGSWVLARDANLVSPDGG